MYRYNFYNISGTGVVILPESAKLLIKEMEEALKNDAGGGGHH